MSLDDEQSQKPDTGPRAAQAGEACSATRGGKTDRVRELTRRSVGRSLDDVIRELRSYLLGWKGSFRLAETPGVFTDVDKWIRHRLRALIVKQDRGGRGNTRWADGRNQTAHTRLLIRFFDKKGVPRLAT